MDDMLRLAERCESASGPDVALDECIYDALFIPAGVDPWSADPPEVTPAYTSSLDDAMSLVPAGAEVTTQTFGGPGPMALVDPNERFRSGKTLPLAICSAALRARHSMMKGE